jgi:hypothetical protein
MVTTNPTAPVNHLHLFSEEVVPRIRQAASVVWDLAYHTTDPQNSLRLYAKAAALTAIADEHEERLTVPQTNADDALLLVALVKQSSHMKNLDDDGIKLAVGYMMEYIP